MNEHVKVGLVFAAIILVIYLGWKGTGTVLKALQPWQSIVRRESIQTGVPVVWINAVILTESNGNPTAFRSEPKINDASYGLMQLLYSTAKALGYSGTSEGLYTPDVNIRLGAKLLGELRGRYGDDFARVYSAYNSGSPDKYKTNTQVAANVARALGNLARVEAEA